MGEEEEKLLNQEPQTYSQDRVSKAFSRTPWRLKTDKSLGPVQTPFQGSGAARPDYSGFKGEQGKGAWVSTHRQLLKGVPLKSRAEKQREKRVEREGLGCCWC